MRRAARHGRDLALERRQEQARKTTLLQAFQTYFELKRKELSNAKHLWQWEASMQSYVFPAIGQRPVADITHAEVLKVLEPIWHTKPETARRVLQRLELVFKSAILRGQRVAASPCTGVAEELGSRRGRVRHHPALPYRDLPAFIGELRSCSANPVTRLCLEWTILTACRSGEARGATWGEIHGNLWTIPTARMKGRREHVVPLSGRCMEIATAARALSPGSLLLFPGRRGPLSDMAMLQVMRRLGVDAVPHGFRSSFKDWAAEVAKVPDEVSEAALAHAIPEKVRAAYLRARFVEERRQLMERWSSYCLNDIRDRKPLTTND
jgi:integrase